MASGQKWVLPEPGVQDKTNMQYLGDPVGAGLREWPALLRILDKKDPSYRD